MDIKEEQVNNVIEEPEMVDEEKEELDEPLKVLEPKPLEEVKEVIKTKTSNLEDDISKLRLTYVEIVAGNTPVSSTSTWEDWDVSSLLPKEAVIADVAIMNSTDAEYIAGIRQEGSVINRFIYISNQNQFMMVVNLGNNRIVERYATNDTNVKFQIMGYYK